MTSKVYNLPSSTRQLNASERARLAIQTNRPTAHLQIRDVTVEPTGIVRFGVRLPSGSVLSGFRAEESGRWITGPLCERLADSRLSLTAEIRRQLSDYLAAVKQ